MVLAICSWSMSDIWNFSRGLFIYIHDDCATGTGLFVHCFSCFKCYSVSSIYSLALCMAFFILHDISFKMKLIIHTCCVFLLFLQVMNVVSHSIANISKRFLVVLLLHALGSRKMSMTNFFGLALAAFGLMIYAKGKLQPEFQLTESKGDGKGCKFVQNYVTGSFYDT